MDQKAFLSRRANGQQWFKLVTSRPRYRRPGEVEKLDSAAVSGQRDRGGGRVANDPRHQTFERPVAGSAVDAAQRAVELFTPSGSQRAAGRLAFARGTPGPSVLDTGGSRA